MALGDIVDELHDDDRLTDARSAERTDFATLGKGTNEVDDFDSCLQDFALVSCSIERRSRTMDRILLGKFDRTALVGGLANNIENTAEDPFTNRNGNRRRRVKHFHSPLKSFGRAHCNCAHPISAQVLLHLEGEFHGPLGSFEIDLERIEYLGHSPSCGLNSTSTTGPITWTIFPLLLMMMFG